MEGIFGRDLELATMQRFLDSAPTWPSAAVIEGEAGIGKTTLWLEGVRRERHVPAEGVIGTGVFASVGARSSTGRRPGSPARGPSRGSGGPRAPWRAVRSGWRCSHG